MGPSQDCSLPPAYPLPASLLQKNFSLRGLPRVPKNKFNQRNEKMQKQRKIVKQDKIIVVQALNKVKELQFPLLSRATDNTLIYFADTFCLQKSPPGGRSSLYIAHKHVDPRQVGTRRLMMLTSVTSLPTNQKNDHMLIVGFATLSSTCSPLLFPLYNLQAKTWGMGSWFFGI